jgi:hypothetical protein
VRTLQSGWMSLRGRNRGYCCEVCLQEARNKELASSKRLLKGMPHDPRVTLAHIVLSARIFGSSLYSGLLCTKGWYFQQSRTKTKTLNQIPIKETTTPTFSVVILLSRKLNILQRFAVSSALLIILQSQRCREGTLFRVGIQILPHLHPCQLLLDR